MGTSPSERPARFVDWVIRPQSLIALSALLLSACGLFVAVYEASLIRQTQRASVWPHVQVGISITNEGASLWVQNTGVGPAHLRAAGVAHRGEIRADWDDLVRSVAGEGALDVARSSSLINGKVLPSGSGKEILFAIGADGGNDAQALASALARAALDAGDLEVEICYCSVFEECWTSSLQRALGRLGDAAASGHAEVESCASAPRSRI